MKLPITLLVLAGASIAIGVACTSSPSNGNPDILASNTDSGGQSLPDGAIPFDFAQEAQCGSIETWCNGNGPCPSTWAAALKPETWCTSGVNAGIYITKSQACDAGYFSVAFIVSTMDPPAHSYFYETTQAGKLVAIGSYYPDDQSGDVTCVAGPKSAAQSIASSGCQYTMYSCVNGVLQ